MNKNDITHPPCISCNAHDDLEAKFYKMKAANKDEHTAILTSVDRVVSNIKWMNLIGKWILSVLLGYFVAIGYHILSSDAISSDEATIIRKNIRAGEVLHYQNEKNIGRINGQLSTILIRKERLINE